MNDLSEDIGNFSDHLLERPDHLTRVSPCYGYVSTPTWRGPWMDVFCKRSPLFRPLCLRCVYIHRPTPPSSVFSPFLKSHTRETSFLETRGRQDLGRNETETLLILSTYRTPRGPQNVDRPFLSGGSFRRRGPGLQTVVCGIVPQTILLDFTPSPDHSIDWGGVRPTGLRPFLLLPCNKHGRLTVSNLVTQISVNETVIVNNKVTWWFFCSRSLYSHI